MADNKNRKNGSRAAVPAKNAKKADAARQEGKTKASDSRSIRTRKDENSKSPETAEKETARREKRSDPDSLINQLLPYLFGVLAVLLTVFLIPSSQGGAIGGVLSGVLFGLFGTAAYAIPVLILIHALVWRSGVRDGTCGAKFAFGIICLFILSTLIGAFAADKSVFADSRSFTALSEAGVFSIKNYYIAGQSFPAAGAVGGMLSALLLAGIGYAATLIVLFSTLIIFMIFLLGISPRMVWIWIRYRRKIAAEKRSERREEQKKLREQREAYLSDDSDSESEGENENDGGVFVPSVPTDKAKPRRGKAPADDTQKPAEQPGEAPSIPDDEISEPIPIDQSIFEKILNDQRNADAITEQAAAKAAQTKQTASFTKQPSAGRKTLSADSITLDEKTGEARQGTGNIELLIEKKRVGGEKAPLPEAVPTPEEPAAAPKKKKASYLYPPIELLAPADKPQNNDVAAELQANAEKLVETLLSFRVRTKIVSVSRGPTITRYELSPEAGTRVRQISNLVDDISLNLATNGVRIEAPIPGKAAVGIEVPNKVVATVHLRELIDTPAFRTAKSKLFVGLGKDVGGTPVFCQLSKMPHLLIAGATGMGKSVCINSIIISLLYNATPNEVKLILVDPKKVELNVYNGIPHLLVPVVSDPKKAAGSLNWAVGEMERRFGLIEEVGARDIDGYNELTANDPEREHIPYIVIIIDELADLMMTAPDAVEESICRLAQKARAAGMHLVIGTQRPSVDVITGLIKANIPSRIAFTVASQVDSKTIIDIGGAEKLIGRGDMLYAPVGFIKPLRVQGAFVSTGEVEKVTDFLKTTLGVSEYDDEVIKIIEREAQKCGRAGDGDDDMPDDDKSDEEFDPKFRQALELAVNAGKISTSLLQRNLSLGYGRAAKIIDRMEHKGYVSAPDGTKPRQVLITKQQYMELVVRGDED